MKLQAKKKIIKNKMCNKIEIYQSKEITPAVTTKGHDSGESESTQAMNLDTTQLNKNVQQWVEKLIWERNLSYPELEIVMKAFSTRLPRWMRTYYQDAFQTTILKLLDQTVSGKIRNPLAYFEKSLRNACIDQWKADIRYQTCETWLADTETEANGSDEKETTVQLCECLRGLDSTELRLLILLYWFTTPREIIAQGLELSKNTIRQKKYRLLSKLKKILLTNPVPMPLSAYTR